MNAVANISRVFNLTQHVASKEQLVPCQLPATWGNPEPGLGVVVDLPEESRKILAQLLTFDTLPSEKDLGVRAHEVLDLVRDTLLEIGFDTITEEEEPIFMIGGAPFFLTLLAQVLEDGLGARCVYAFSQRVSVESADGVKTSVFKHLGYVPHVRD